MKVYQIRKEAVQGGLILILSIGLPSCTFGQSPSPARLSSSDTTIVKRFLYDNPNFSLIDTTYMLKGGSGQWNWSESPEVAIFYHGSHVLAARFFLQGDTIISIDYHRNGSRKRVTKEGLSEPEWFYDARWCEDGSKMWEWRPSSKEYQRTQEYNCDGFLVADIQLNKGVRCGPYRSYYPNGQQKMIGQYIGCSALDSLEPKWDQFEGIWRNYSISGVLIFEIGYSNGEMNGIFNSYHESGQPFMNARYSKGRLIEIVSYQNAKGALLQVGTFNDGSGTVIVYDEDDQIVRTDHYIGGIKQDN